MNPLQLAEMEEIEEITEVEGIQRERFTIQTKEEATWALRKLKVLQEGMEEVNHLAAMEIERIEGWRRNENQKKEDSMNFFKGLLEEFLRKENGKDPKVKSIKLPYGTFRLKKQQPQYIRDEEELINWAEGEGYFDYIKIKKALNWSALKKDLVTIEGKAIVKDTGEALKAIEIKYPQDKFEVEVK
ncbi:MAG: host-nuclease inhibitor Gam family protein [Clostridiaceae bacterium]|nr:host-nuclease inhibitor Gam family protein [Clostridiaceae bacterium]